MIYLHIRQTVRDDKQWKEAFDIHFSARQAGGAITDVLVLCNANDPYEIVLLLGWCSLEQAKTFVHSFSWQMVQREMGVIGETEVRFLEGVGGRPFASRAKQV